MRREVFASLFLLLAALGAKSCYASQYATAATCESLSRLTLPHAKITRAQTIKDGSFTVPGGSSKLDHLPPFCRVAITSSPTVDSLVHIEVWIPLGKAWNGRYLQSGCAGFCGIELYSSLAFSVRRGYAGAITDDGDANRSSGPGAPSFADGSFALKHPQKVLDYGYRALKETTDDAKMVLAALRRGEPRYSYFMGCSDGGREALMEAQRFPDDFDGIIVGAPANNWTHQMAGMLGNEQALLDKPASYLPQSALPILSKAVLAQCGKHDTGAPGDAFLSDPEDCDFDPSVIQCAPGQKPDSCLTPAQIEAVRAIYKGPHDPRTGSPITPGFVPTGSEDATWPLWVVGASREADLHPNGPPGSLQFYYANRYFADFVYKDPQKFNFRAINLGEAIAKAEAGPGAVIDSTKPDLRPFEVHGGKIIQYHGWADPVLTPWTSVDYYHRVNALLYGQAPSRNSGSYRQIQSFYRLFMVPGMSHCWGGPGPNVFGGWGNPADPPSIDAKHDILTALDRWVEHGAAPEELIATHYVGDDRAKGIQFQRPLCVYPQVAHYKGHGSPSKARSFTCR